MEAKKNPELDLSKKSFLFFNLGLVISLALVTTAFEWKSYDRINLLAEGQIIDNFEDLTDIPITQQPPPPPLKTKQVEIVEVPDEEEIIEEIEIDLDLDAEITEDTEIEEIIFEEPIKEEIIEEVFTIVEQNPTFKGGDISFIKYLKSNLNYPEKARRMGIEGRVFVQLIVEKDGSLTDFSIIRGIGGDCNDEAIKVMQKSPNWIPGKQRGRPVRVQMIIPISFKLI